MPDDRTLVTELAMALGTLPAADLPTSLNSRPAELRINVEPGNAWRRIHGSGHLAHQFDLAFANWTRPGSRRRRAVRTGGPGIIEWTGGRRPPGDEVAPIDLRIDHVYLISCKYDSDILANTSPARLFHGLLATSGGWDRSDPVGPGPRRVPGPGPGLPRGHRPDRPAPKADLCTRDEHDRLRRALKDRSYPDDTSREAYAAAVPESERCLGPGVARGARRHRYQSGARCCGGSCASAVRRTSCSASIAAQPSRCIPDRLALGLAGRVRAHRLHHRCGGGRPAPGGLELHVPSPSLR